MKFKKAAQKHIFLGRSGFLHFGYSPYEWVTPSIGLRIAKNITGTTNIYVLSLSIFCFLAYIGRNVKTNPKK